MTKITLSLAISGIALAVAALPGAAHAQATRTWLSGTGDDSNPCSRTSACKSLGGAMAKTAAGGEIDCLDPLGPGPATITKSLTIDCSGAFGSIIGGGDGIVVNLAKSSDVVTLRGLSISGMGGGANGIRFSQTGTLNLDRVAISGFTQNGVDFEPSADAQLFVSDTTTRDNGGAGVLVKAPAGVAAKAFLLRATAQHNAGFGILADGKGAIVGIGGATIAGNATGVGVNNGAVMQSYGENAIGGNGNDGVSSLTPIELH
jgi:hypothetical protein